MYGRTYWLDHIVDEDSQEVLQQGTLQDAEHFNNMEEGIFAGNETALFMAEQLRKQQSSMEAAQGEIIQVELKNKNTQGYPFNDSEASVHPARKMTTTDYLVIPEVVSYTGGGVGDIEITEKLLNGFKVRYTGGATSVVVNLHISGGD